MSRYQFENLLLKRNQNKVFRYINTRCNDWHYKNKLAERFDLYPEISMQIVNDYYLPNDVKINRFLNYVCSGSKIGTICGKRGSGKTQLMLWVATQVACTGRKICFVNFCEDDKDIPKGLGTFYPDIPSCPDNSFIFHDEYAMINKKWDTKENIENTKIMAVSRHFGKTIVYCAQNISSFPIDIIRFCDFNIYKMFSLKQLETDKQNFFDHIANFIPQNVREVLFESNDFISFFNNPLPVFFK